MQKIRRNYGQAGSIAEIAIIFVLAIALIVLGIMIFNISGSRNDYKNNVDAKVAAAVKTAQAQQQTKDQQQFAEQSKQPYLTFKGPQAYGSVSFNYPRTWNVYYDETDQSNPLTSYFYNGPVPVTASGATYALRVDLVSDDYATVVSGFDDSVTNNGLKASAYVPPKMAGVANVQTGTRFDGPIESDQQNNPIQGSMIVLKIRDKTLKLYTESPDFLNDFNNTVLASLTYAP